MLVELLVVVAQQQAHRHAGGAAGCGGVGCSRGVGCSTVCVGGRCSRGGGLIHVELKGLPPPSPPTPPPQGRLPIRVELKGLTAADFLRILTEPENNMIRQQQVGGGGGL